MQWLELIGGLVVAAFLMIGAVRYFSTTVPWTPSGEKGPGTTPPYPSPFVKQPPQEKGSVDATK